MRPLPKTDLKEGDKDFDQYTVTVDGSEQRPDLLISADAAKGEVTRRRIDGDGNILTKETARRGADLQETVTGFVLIQRRPVYAEPNEDPVPGSTVDKTKPKADNPAADPAASGLTAGEVDKQSVKEAAKG